MKNLLLSLALLYCSGCATALLTGAGSNRYSVHDSPSSQQRNTDQIISEKINRLLIKSPQVRATDIRVRTEHMVVTLTGVVTKNTVKVEAERLAASVSGVKAVKSRIIVAE